MNKLPSELGNISVITLEQWNEAVNGFELPKKWYVKATLENRDILKQTSMKTIIGYKLIKPEYKKAAIEIVNVLVNWNTGRSFESIMGNNPDNHYIEKLTEAGVLDIWFEAIYEDDKIMLDNSEYEIVVKGVETHIDDYLFKKEFWECAKIITEHSKADVVLGCGAKDIRSENRWSVSLETINKVLDRIS